MRRGPIVLGIVAILASSCGGGELSPQLATTLQDRVAAIRDFAEAGRPGLARTEVRELVALVTSRMEAGVLDEGRAVQILEAARAVAEELTHLPRSEPESPSPAPPPVEEDDEEGEGEGKPDKDKDKDEDKGKGNGGDEGHGNDG